MQFGCKHGCDNGTLIKWQQAKPTPYKFMFRCPCGKGSLSSTIPLWTDELRHKYSDSWDKLVNETPEAKQIEF